MAFVSSDEKQVKTLNEALQGVADFKAEASKTPDKWTEMAKGQGPGILFITCSDSRVPPNLLTKMEFGDLFVLRNAGNMVPAYGVAHGGEAGTIEYAMLGLDIPNIIVCGHSKCGAMGALMAPTPPAGLPVVTGWLEHAHRTRAVVDAKHPSAKQDERVAHAVEHNVLAQIQNLLTHPSVAARVATGKTKIFGWIFDIEQASLRAYDPAKKRFVELDASSAGFHWPMPDIESKS